MNQIWTPMEEQFIRENADKLTDKAGAVKLTGLTGRTVSVYAWRKKRQKMGLTKAPGRGVCRVVTPFELSRKGR